MPWQVIMCAGAWEVVGCKRSAGAFMHVHACACWPCLNTCTVDNNLGQVACARERRGLTEGHVDGYYSHADVCMCVQFRACVRNAVHGLPAVYRSSAYAFKMGCRCLQLFQLEDQLRPSAYICG
eukprot:1160652-Pelagomonas_calceolata.AAC.2